MKILADHERAKPERRSSRQPLSQRLSWSGKVKLLREGEANEKMFVVQDGKVEIVREIEAGEARLAVLEEGDFFGEVPFFERRGGSGGVARATVRAVGDVRAITVDRKTLLRRIHEDPSLAYRILEVMSKRVKTMEEQVLGAEEKRVVLEFEIFDRIRKKVALENQRIKETAEFIAEIDVIAGLAETAEMNNYICPEINESAGMDIIDGRHPVIECDLGRA